LLHILWDALLVGNFLAPLIDKCLNILVLMRRDLLERETSPLKQQLDGADLDQWRRQRRLLSILPASLESWPGILA